MATPIDDASATLKKRLDDVTQLLATGSDLPVSRRPHEEHSANKRGAGGTALGLSAALVVLAFATGQWWMMAPALALAVTAGVLLFGRLGQAVASTLPAGLAQRDPNVPHIGMGATIGRDARVEPGASVEMGATLGDSAVVKRGAVVRMGACVHARAVIEEGAVVSWGVTIADDAVVGAHAVIGAGATVARGARVPSGTRILAGTTWSGGSSALNPEPERRVPAGVIDPREQRIDALCDRLESELRQAPSSMREYLGATSQVIGPLRQTCRGLLRRERMLRAEATGELLAGLDQERVELERRIGAGTDDAVRRSLAGAVAAIDDQKRGRESMGRSADRLDAELTRLLWTLDGMGAQMVRLRSAGAEVSAAPDPEMLHSVKQLHDEIDAIASALEQVVADDRHSSVAREGQLAPISPISSDPSASPRRDRNRL